MLDDHGSHAVHKRMTPAFPVSANLLRHLRLHLSKCSCSSCAVSLMAMAAFIMCFNCQWQDTLRLFTALTA